MKINWGTGIFLFYAFFATTLFYQVYKSTQYDHSLVVEDYYAKDIAYQKTYDKLSNSMALKTPLKVNYYDVLELVEIEFPPQFQQINGSLLFYRASDKKEDTRLPIRINLDNCMQVFVHTLPAGIWKVEVDWIGDGTPFLDREIIEVKPNTLLSLK